VLTFITKAGKCPELQACGGGNRNIAAAGWTEKFPVIENTADFSDVFSLHWLVSIDRNKQSPFRIWRDDQVDNHFRLRNLRGMGNFLRSHKHKRYRAEEFCQIERLFRRARGRLQRLAFSCGRSGEEGWLGWKDLLCADSERFVVGGPVWMFDYDFADHVTILIRDHTPHVLENLDLHRFISPGAYRAFGIRRLGDC